MALSQNWAVITRGIQICWGPDYASLSLGSSTAVADLQKQSFKPELRPRWCLALGKTLLQQDTKSAFEPR